MTLAARFARDLKASGPKTAVLGVLVLVGLYFWIPPLWRAVAGSGTSASAAPSPAPAAPAAATAAAPTTAPATPDAPKAVGWQEAERLREQDDLFRPAGRSDLNGEAFTFRDDFLPLDVEFGEFREEQAKVVAKAAAAPLRNETTKSAEPAAPEAPPLTLQSTLVGPGRRVAVINSRVYAEGATVPAGGKLWTLLNVEPRRVLLDGGGRTYELTIDPFATAQARQ